jgi:hypothetical protein
MGVLFAMETYLADFCNVINFMFLVGTTLTFITRQQRWAWTPAIRTSHSTPAF